MSRQKYYSIRSYFSYMATYKVRLGVTALMFVIASVLLSIVPLFIGQFVAALAGQPLDPGQVYWFAALLIFCSVGHDAAWRTAEILYLKLLLKKNIEFENTVFRNVINREYPYFVGKFTGKISSYVSTLGREYNDFISTIFYSYIDQIIKLPVIAGIMFSVNIYTGAVFLAGLFCLLMAGRLTVKRMVREEKKATDAYSSMEGYSIDVISNFVSVKAFKKENAERETVEHKRKHVVKTAQQAMTWGIVFWGTMSIIVRWIIWPLTILLNVYLFIEGQITLAEITTFISAITLFSDYIWGTIWNVTQVTLKLARIEEAYQYLFGKRNIVREPSVELGKRLPATAFTNDLTLRGLTFAYPDKKNRQVLQQINLTVKKNEKIGVVGHSGSGKTTLIKLLLGYYPLPQKSVLLDGVAIDNRDLAYYMSYVPQDTALFHRSVRDNIAYAVDGRATDAEIEAAARKAHAHEFITHTSEGYDTMVGERGIKLSMGQRQRVAIARAFLDDKPILVLDEATSALDSESEVLVQDALENLWQDRTVIAIAHRLSTLRHMDRIIVMDDGKIVEQGSHKELLALKGQYYDLWQHQSGGMIVEDED